MRLLKILGGLLAIVGLANFCYCGLLLFHQGPPERGGIDLLLRWYDVRVFFRPGPFYGVWHFSVYPPASYVMLWPLVGWAPSFETARLAFAVQLALLIPALAWIGCRIAGARSGWQSLFVVALVLTNFGLGVCVKNGQVSIHILLLLFAAYAAQQCRHPRWFLASLCLTLAMIKPAFAIPFFVALVFRPSGWLSVWSGVTLYGWLTFSFKPYQGYDVWGSLAQWRKTLEFEEEFIGYGDLHSLLRLLGHLEWLFPVALAALVLYACFLYKVRRAEPLLLFVLTAAFARIWGYHRVYDDVLLLPLGFVLVRAVFAKPGTGLKWLTGLFAVAHLNIQFLLPANEALIGLGGQIFRMLASAGAVAWLLREIWNQRGGAGAAAEPAGEIPART